MYGTAFGKAHGYLHFMFLNTECWHLPAVTLGCCYCKAFLHPPALLLNSFEQGQTLAISMKRKTLLIWQAKSDCWYFFVWPLYFCICDKGAKCGKILLKTPSSTPTPIQQTYWWAGSYSYTDKRRAIAERVLLIDTLSQFETECFDSPYDSISWICSSQI